MQEDQVFSTQDNSSTTRNKRSGKSAALVIGLIILIIGVGAVAFFAGKSSTNSSEPTPTISLPQEVTSTSSPSPSPSPEPTLKLSGTVTPTKKLTSTPTVTLIPSPIVKSKILQSSATLDGFRSSNNGGNLTLDIRAGRNSNLVTRGFVSFVITDIPSGSTIKEATLRLYQAKIIGSPYAAGGTLKIDHLTYGDSLDSSDYGVAALLSSFATLTNNQTIEWKDIDVTTEVKDDISNARVNSQYRIHFQTEQTGGDVTGDFTYFESADNSEGTGNAPQLIVKYY